MPPFPPGEGKKRLHIDVMPQLETGIDQARQQPGVLKVAAGGSKDIKDRRSIHQRGTILDRDNNQIRSR